MSKSEEVKNKLESLRYKREILQEKIEYNNKKQVALSNLINRSAIFDENIIYRIAWLLTEKDDHKDGNIRYLPFTYSRRKNIMGFEGEDLFVGIATDKNILEFINSKSDNLDDFFNSKRGYELFKKRSEVVEDPVQDRIIMLNIIYDTERDKIVFDFLLDDYNIKNRYNHLIASALYDFKDFEYVQNFIRYLFELQLRKNGNQLSPIEMDEALNDFMYSEEKKERELRKQ